MTRGLLDRDSRQPSARAALAGLLLFSYGALVVGVLFRVGGLSGLPLVVALQATSVPMLFATAWVTASRRPALVPAFVLALVAGTATRIAFSVAPRAGVGEALEVALVVVPNVAGFAVSWAILGYVGGTALRWNRRGERIARLEVLRSCSLVLAGTVLSAAFYGVSWTFLVVGLGDQIA